MKNQTKKPHQVKLLLKQVFTLGILSGCMALFQNCSGGFSSVNSGVASFESLSDPNFLKGQALYNQNCIACHGEFASSTKKLRTASQIWAAIDGQPNMQFLSSLTKDEVALIAYALSNPNGTKGQIYQCKNPSTRGMSYDHIRRLSRSELSNTLESLLGSTIFNDSFIQTKINGLPTDQLKDSPTDFFENPNTYLAGALFDVSIKAAELLAANTSLRGTILDACTQTAITEDCIRKVINGFGKKVLRRKPTTTEIDEYVAFYAENGGGLDGLQLVLIRLLQNPSLVFHLENGSGKINNGRYRLTDYEIASRISYQTAGTMPDAALFAAAENGELQNIENVRLHVRRLLGTSLAKKKVDDFFQYYMKLNTTPVLHPAVLGYAGIDGSGLGQAMQQEAFDFVHHVVWSREGNFNELMTSTAAFPRTAALASVLDAPIMNGNTPSQAPTHVGLLHRPALLSNAADRTSPIMRGAHIRKMYLCDELGVPPADAVAAREDELGDISDMSNRDRTGLLTQSAACIGCHSQINNLGFTFESFSPLGQYRAKEPLFAPDGSYLKEFPINTIVDDPKIEAGGPTQLDDSVELVKALAKSKKAQACFAKKVFEFYKVKAVHPGYDSCLLSESSSSASALSLQAVFADSIANDDIFWRKDNRGESQ